MSSSKPATVVITSYNYGRFLRECVESALGQTYSNTQVIVVDDGSLDESPDILRSYGERIRLVVKENGGQGSAFNAGFALSRGEVVCFLDSDDVLLPTAIETAVNSFRDPGVSMVHWPSRVIDVSGKDKGQVLPKRALAQGNLRNKVIRGGPNSFVWASTSSCAWSRAFLEKVLPMPESDYWTFCDSYLATLAPLFGTLSAVRTPQTLYRSHGGGIHARVTIDQTLRVCERDCLVLENLLRQCGIQADPERWGLTLWRRQLAQALQDIETTIPSGETIILVDEDNWGAHGLVNGRRALPFTERKGLYGGPPLDDRSAIEEFERLRCSGASFMVFAWQGFWWLEYYRGLQGYLDSLFPRVLANDRVVVFDLRPVVRAPVVEKSPTTR